MEGKKEDMVYIGQVTWRGKNTNFGIKVDDRRRHMYLVGKTGMGKSNLLENMAIQDIQSGKGVAFIDPHGEAAEKILDYVPSWRVNDVIYFNPGDVSYPTAFNVMEITNPEQRNLIAAGLMAVFKKIWPDVWSARMEYILNNTILALLEYPNATLLAINRMFSDPGFRAKVVEKVTDPIIKSFWLTEYANYDPKYERESTAAIQNKIGQFIANPLMRNILGQVKSSIDMRKIMDEKKILIVNISKGMVGEDSSRLFGAMLITKLQLAAMSRSDVSEEAREDFYLYVDEFQNFATESFANILSEARKYRLNLILANQYLGQLEEMGASGKSSKVKDAVFGNVGTMIIFRVGAEDAEFLEPEFAPDILIEDFVNLGKYHVYLKLMIDGITSSPFSAHTLPPIEKLAISEKEKIISVSRERYSVLRAIIEEKIAKWTGEMDESTVNNPPAKGNNQSKMHEITCSMCGKKTKVIFEPEPGRKVYCKPCLKKLQERGPVPQNNNTPGDFGAPVSVNNLPPAAPQSFTPQNNYRPPAVPPQDSYLPPATPPQTYHPQNNSYHQGSFGVPTNNNPVNSAPVNSAPVNSAPVNSAPVNSAPVNSAPVNSAPVNSAPVNSAPVNSAPVNSAPVNSAPVNSAPVNSAPVNSAPVNSAPVNSAPVNSAPPPFSPQSRPRISLSDLNHADPVRFSGQRNSAPRIKKEVHMDELKKALSDALGGAIKRENDNNAAGGNQNQTSGS